MNTSGGLYIKGGAACVALLLLLILGVNWVTSFDAPKPGYVGVCQTGGPIEGDQGTCGVLQPGTGKRNLGLSNNLREFPATQRFYLIGQGGDGGQKQITLPTSDGINVDIQGQAMFTLNLDEETLLDFYKKYGTRTFGGKYVWDGDNGFEQFLDKQFRPVLESALREEILNYKCADLNPGCARLAQVEQDSNKTAKDKGKTTVIDKGEAANRNLTTIANNIAKKLDTDLKATLNGTFFTGVRFKISRVTLGGLQAEVNKANAASLRVATAEADGRADLEKAKALRLAKEEEAKGIRALNSAYANSRAKAEIDKWKAICGESGCPIEVIGSTSVLRTTGKNGG